MQAQSAQTMASCLDEGKKFYAQQDYSKAVSCFTRCVKMDKDNVEAHLSLAGGLLAQNDLDQAQLHFEQALKNMKRTSPYWSYTYSMLGDISLRKKQYKQALSMYTKSLEYNVANVNSLIGKGVVLQMKGDIAGATAAYQSALAVEPLNLIARQRLISLEPEYFSDEEILTALKQRLAIKPEERSLKDKDRELFIKIHDAEERRGVDYLKNKYGAQAQNLIVTLNKDTDFSREMLSLDGFNALEKSIGQDAVALFSQKGIPIQSIFDLRDKQGKPIFTKETTLTESGFYAYTQALAGKKEYLLPNEMVPLTTEEKKKLRVKIERLKQSGYIEISRAELTKLEEQTLCSQETLQESLGLYEFSFSKKLRLYFVKTEDKDPMRTVSYYYIMSQRKKRNPRLVVPKNSVVEFHQRQDVGVCLSDGKLTYGEE